MIKTLYLFLRVITNQVIFILMATIPSFFFGYGFSTHIFSFKFVPIIYDFCTYLHDLYDHPLMHGLVGWVRISSGKAV